jgi:hypothetical protein
METGDKKMTKQETAYLASIEKFDAAMKSGDLGLIKLAERALSRSTKAYCLSLGLSGN